MNEDQFKIYLEKLEKDYAKTIIENKILEHQVRAANEKIKVLESVIRCTLGAKREYKVQFFTNCKKEEE